MSIMVLEYDAEEGNKESQRFQLSHMTPEEKGSFSIVGFHSTCNKDTLGGRARPVGAR